MAKKTDSKESRNGARKHPRDLVSRESGANPTGSKAAKKQTRSK